jgi:hypothetical protein
MKHSGIMLGVIFTMVAVQGWGAHQPTPTKSHLSVSANLNPQSQVPKAKITEDTAEPDEPPVLEKGSRVVASNNPDEDFVILGSLEPTLPEPPHIETEAEKQTQTNELVEKALADASPRVTEPVGPPALLKAPVEVKTGIQPKVAPEAVMVAGPNIGATPAVKPTKIKPSTAALTLASVSPKQETSALKPPPAMDVLLQRADKTVAVVKAEKTPAPVIKPSVKLAEKAPAPAIKSSVKVAEKMSVKAGVKVALKSSVKTSVKVAVKTPVKTAVASKVKHLIAKVDMPKVKPVHLALAPHKKLSKPVITTAALHAKQHSVKSKFVFASYQPPKHSKLIKPKVVAVKSVKASFKPVVKPFKPTSLRVERKSHFHPVIKPYIAS